MAKDSAHRRWQVRVLAGLFASLLTLSGLALLAVAPAQAAAPIQRWSQADTSGERWAISLFEQLDPDFEPGWRLRLNALGLDLRLDHQRPMEVQGATGTHWQLANRIEEEVPAGEAAIPAGSAQFDLVGLVPRPSNALPLRISIPLQDAPDRDLMLSPEIVAAISTAGEG